MDPIFKISISCFLEDLDPIFKIFKKYPFHAVGRYWSHFQEFQEFIKRIFWICRSPSFPKKAFAGDPIFWDFPKSHSLKSFGTFSCISWSLLVGPKSNIIGFGSHGHVRQVRKPWTWRVCGPVKLGPTDPLDPTSAIFPDFTYFHRRSAISKAAQPFG